ncbi:winged helix-turn-helix domain-containing protein [Mesorhizobium sp.]|uniref:winged helix-turn-helix domain-containing protein n=1 Tax=Mesorhizobium sp. TaxID=1871066 RepID=UPI00257BE052|nr:winged helix-turn-helix domain-containing protein [Mesorhizobium sp.]
MQYGTLMREGKPVAIGHKGCLLLHALVQAAGQVLSKAALIEAAWPDTIVEESNLSVQIAALRKLLGPQPDGSAWIVTVSRTGYRFAGHVRVLDAAAGSNPSALQQPAAFPERPSIAVLPFANVSDDKEQAYLADGITEDIITALTRFRWFRVIGRNSSFVYKDKCLGSKQVAGELGVRYVLEGSVRRSGSHVRVSVQLSMRLPPARSGPNDTRWNWRRHLPFRMPLPNASPARSSPNCSRRTRFRPVPATPVM